MIVDFFNQRQKALSGAEAAYQLVMSETREFIGRDDDASSDTVSDLDFGKDSEKWYTSSFLKYPDSIAKARKEYYAELPKRLAKARELARGTRPPTKDEVKYPPPTEVELQAERLKKEIRWREDLVGWEILRPSTPVAWDPRFRGVLRVFVPPLQNL